MATVVMRSSDLYSCSFPDVLQSVHASTAQDGETNQWQAFESAVGDEGLWNSLHSKANANLAARQQALACHQPSPSLIQATSSMLIQQEEAVLWMSSQHLLKSPWMLTYWVKHPEGRRWEEHLCFFFPWFPPSEALWKSTLWFLPITLQSVRQFNWAPGSFSIALK